MSVEATGKRDPLSLITDHHVQSALRKDKGDEAHLLTWHTNNFTEKGDNMATVVTKVVVDYHLRSETHQTSYVVKLNPCITTALSDTLMATIFEKEVNFYEEILPDLNRVLKKAGQESLRMPELLHSSLAKGNEILFLKDLGQRGFVMVDKYKGQAEANIWLAIKELARLHASSYLLQAEAPDVKLTERYPLLLKDWIMCSEEEKEGLNNMMAGNFSNSVLVLRYSGRHSVAAWVERVQSNVVDLLQEQLKRNPPFEVICHGDCWNNNMLFRYNEVGDAVEVMLVDNQVGRVASPALDLVYYLYASVFGHIRRAKLHNFLEEYYSTFSGVIQAGGATVPFTLSELREEFRKKMAYGLMFCLMVVPFYLLKGEDVPSAEEFLNKDAKGMEAWKQKVENNIHDNPTLEQYFFATVDDMLEAGVIS